MLAMSMVVASSLRRFVEASVARAGLCTALAIVGAHLGPPVRAQSVVAWGLNTFGECNVPQFPPGAVPVAVAAGSHLSVAAFADGSIVTWGWGLDGQASPPTLPPGRRAVKLNAGEGNFCLALLDDGSLVGWGNNAFGQAVAPPLPLGVVYVDAAAGGGHTVAVRSDGSALAWGYNNEGQCNVPATPPGLTYVAASAGHSHSALLRSDGALVAFGRNDFGQCNVGPTASSSPIVSIGTGLFSTSALHADGVVSSWGDCTSCECCVAPAPPANPYVQMSVGQKFTVLTRADGTLAVVGQNAGQQLFPPNPPAGQAFVQTSGGNSHAIALTGAPCALVASYCTAGTTVHGCVPSIGGVGAPSSQATSGFDIVVSDVPGQRFGTIFYGFYPLATPWAPGSSSSKCVAFPIQRTGDRQSGGTAGQCNGELRLDFNAWRAANSGALGSPYVAGQVIYAQGWFRDPGAPKQTNLSDGLRFVLCD
jgi:hypothetical protein